ncbi:uncharacterized protein LOC130828114 isoform X2 [Amaranthus tricolor]|uniref:uncharacterized protein LOC130828114 isoform X2 n=1 Tax=Amaranthus tricolor TaxID=29722 RepID=UPI00258D9C18|nr:uncharacterized protein LOC130828114 isoform X2 [Amaranthus tricolor]
MAMAFESRNLFAAIDMGTNSFKLQIIHFEPTVSKLTTLQTHSEAVGLGRNPLSSSQPLISPDSQFRAIEVLLKFQSILRSQNVTRIRVVGTSAIREASNRDIFLNEVKKKLGFDFHVNILSGVEEARLIYLGVLQFLPIYDKRVLTLDIGGGSTEFVVGNYGRVLFADSIRLGHLTLTQKFGENDLVGLKGYIREVIEASGLVGKVKNLGFEVAVGSSGTILAIEKAIWSDYGSGGEKREVLKNCGRSRRKNWWFSWEELKGLVEGLCGVRARFSQNEKAKRDEFFGKRSEFIVAGAVLLDEILELFGINEMMVSGYALGEGVVAENVSEDCLGSNLYVNEAWKSVKRLAMRFNGKDRMKNCAECLAIAKVIFRGLRKNKKFVDDRFAVDICLNDKDLEYLEAACMLHNVGLYFGKKGYHKRSYSIVMSELDGYSIVENQLIAQLARYHRKKFPNIELISLQGVSKEKFGIICSILRISVIIQKHTQLELREISFDDSSEGFVLFFVMKGGQPMLLEPEMLLLAKDLEGKIAIEAKLFEAVFHQKLLVVTHMGC